jgi:hypothetical protein
MLPLYGVALKSRGFDDSRPWQVLRLQSASIGPCHSADAALIRSSEELTLACSTGFTTAVAVGDNIDIRDDGPRELALLASRFDYLSEGDVLGFQSLNGRVRTLYRRASMHNSFLVTERCNHYCLMCSQPPRDIDDRWLLDEIKAALDLVDPETRCFTFTGGEPLLEWRAFINVLERCRDVLPNTSIHVLTNGRGFANSEVAQAWANIRHPKLMAGIPVYSAVDNVHDYLFKRMAHSMKLFWGF